MVWLLGVQTRWVAVGALRQVHSTHCVLYSGDGTPLAWLLGSTRCVQSVDSWVLAQNFKGSVFIWELALRPELIAGPAWAL